MAIADLGQPLEWVTVKTTLPKPYPPMSARKPILTKRLILRPYTPTDIDAFHALRLQPEVMRWTSQGRPDKDLAHTLSVLEARLPGSPAESEYEFAVCWAATGEMIGTAGSHMRKGEFGWPVIGYMLRSEFWGRGLATELVQGFLERYWSLEREEVEIEVERSTVVDLENGLSEDGLGEVLMKECINAVTAWDNGVSQRVLDKTGFRLARRWVEEEDPRTPGETVELCGYIARRPSL